MFTEVYICFVQLNLPLTYPPYNSNNTHQAKEQLDYWRIAAAIVRLVLEVSSQQGHFPPMRRNHLPCYSHFQIPVFISIHMFQTSHNK
jgi:beta-xylosidase